MSQTLAGRIAFLTLLPLSIGELKKADKLPHTAEELIFKGSYPRLHHDSIDPPIFAESYIRTYVERDVRDLLKITSLLDFQKFIRLCAARIGQLLEISNLAKDAGVSIQTAKAWLSVLEASYVIFLLQPFYRNLNKRVIKSPKLYFYDTGLACHLLRITSADDVYDHYLKGNLFESMVVSDFYKKQFHNAFAPNVYFWKSKSGLEIDCLLEEGAKLIPVEIKTSQTIQSDKFDHLIKWADLAKTPIERGKIIYGGDEDQVRSQGSIISWKNL